MDKTPKQLIQGDFSPKSPIWKQLKHLTSLTQRIELYIKHMDPMGSVGSYFLLQTLTEIGNLPKEELENQERTLIRVVRKLKKEGMPITGPQSIPMSQWVHRRGLP